MRTIFLTLVLCLGGALALLYLDPVFAQTSQFPGPWTDNGSTISAATGRSVTIGGTVLRGGGATLPATCSVGNQYFLTSGTTGNYQCTATNTWTLPGGGSGTAPYTCTVTAVSSIACTHGLNTSTPWVVGYDGSGNMLGGTGATTTITSVVATSANVATITFSGTTTGTVLISTGSIGPPGATGPAGPTGGVTPGSSFAMPVWVEFLAGACQNATASIGFSTPTANAPTAICITGSNTQIGAAQYSATGQSVQGSMILPDDWTSIMALEFRFISEAASGGNVVWDLRYACVANTAASLDPSLAAAQPATVAAGANNVTNLATLATPTISGCTAGQKMFFRIGLNASTTATGNQDLLSIRFQIKRTVTVL